MLRLTLAFVLFPVIACAQTFSPGDVAGFAVQELSKAYSMGAQALTSCYQSKEDLKKENDALKEELAKLKGTK